LNLSDTILLIKNKFISVVKIVANAVNYIYLKSALTFGK